MKTGERLASIALLVSASFSLGRLLSDVWWLGVCSGCIGVVAIIYILFGPSPSDDTEKRKNDDTSDLPHYLDKRDMDGLVLLHYRRQQAAKLGVPGPIVSTGGLHGIEERRAVNLQLAEQAYMETLRDIEETYGVDRAWLEEDY